MATTFVHIGDFHAAPGPRNADRFAALDQIVCEGLELRQLGAWLWPGDLFDAASTVDDRNAIDQRLQRMAAVAPVVVCYGNHDRPGDLDGFGRLQATHPIYVIDRPHVVTMRLATGEMAAVFALPYPQKAGLVGAGVAAGDVVDTAADILEPVFMQAAAQLADAHAAGYLTLMIGHVNVAGAIASTGQPNIGREIELSPRHLDRLGNIPKLLNHIHKPQDIAGAHYAGSVCRMDYGEIEEKSYIVMTIDRSIVLAEEGQTNWSIERRPIAVPPMFHIDGVLDRNGFVPDSQGIEIDETIDRRVGAGDWEGCDVRVRYRYKASERAVVDESHVRDLFAGALRLKVEGVAEPDRELRAPEVAMARTLPEKLAAYRKEPQLPSSVASKLALLEGHDSTTVLAHVASLLRSIEQPATAQVAA